MECEAIETALATFQSVRRRMEIKGEARGVLVVEDFAHHPTAIRMTLEATRTRWPGRKIWAAVEPRSNTMRRKIFEHVLPEALAIADAVVIGPVNRAQLLDEDGPPFARINCECSLSPWENLRRPSNPPLRSPIIWRRTPSRAIW